MTGTDAATTVVPDSKMEVFTFGEPVPVLDGRDLAGYFQSWWNGQFYEPPISFDGLARALPANTHHQSAIVLKANLLASCFVPHRLLSRQDFKRLVMDHLVFGNCYVERRTNWVGGALKLVPAPARWTRVARDDSFLMLVDGGMHPFPAGAVLHLLEPDINQEIYGVPGYTGALQSAFLNEAATLFRRRYYLNGSHAGFILYISDASQNPEDIDAIRKALKESKGVGNFKNLFMYAPNGKAEGVKVIPIAEVMARDEFLNIKSITRDDVLAAHRVPPQLLGMVPANAGGFGDVEKAAGIFGRNELQPLMATFSDINAWVGDEVVRFDPYVVGTPPAPAASGSAS